jgi:hypothetical protein
MSQDATDALLRVAGRIAAGEDLTSELMNAEGVPVPLRLVLAAATLTAADLPVNKKSITTAAPAARSATYRDHAELLEQAKTLLPALVQAQLSLVGARVTAVQLGAQLEEANKIISAERARCEEAEQQLQHVTSYARELHWQLRPEHEAALREREQKVRPLRPIPTAPDDAPPTE